MMLIGLRRDDVFILVSKQMRQLDDKRVFENVAK